MTRTLLVAAMASLLFYSQTTLAQENNATGQSTITPGKFLGAKDSSYPHWFKESFLNFEEDVAEATSEGKRLALYFHQAGCPYCNKLIEDNFANQEIGSRFRDAFDLVAINMWGDREVVQVGGKEFTEKTLAAALNVKFTPTILFFDENKKVALRLNGYYPPTEFTTAIDYVSAKMETQLSYSEFVNSLKLKNRSGKLNEAGWLLPAPYNLSKFNDDKPIAVLFEEPECENCDLLHRKTFADPTAMELLSKFNVIQLNRWSDTAVTKPDGRQTTANKWANELGLGYAPGILLMDASGNEVIKISAMFRTFHILGAFDYTASEAYLLEPSFQRYLSERAEHIIQSGKNVDIWKY